MNLGCLITTDKIVTYTTIFENTSSNMKRSKMKALIDSAEERDSMSSTLGYLSGMLAENPKKYEELCDVLHAVLFPSARLPWISIVPSKRSYVQTAHYQIQESSAEEKCRSLQLQRILAAAIPYYLPKRYHAMDCLSLLEHSSGNKYLHFANATQLFTFNQLYGLHFWFVIAKDLHHNAKLDFKLTVHLLNFFYHSFKTQSKLFGDEGDLHQCETPAEFLLEPWLLMQLPWNPVLYNQWLAAALAEVLTAKKEIVEFYRWPVPEKLSSPVRKLLSQVETLHRRLLSGFGLINFWLSNARNFSELNLTTVACVMNQVIIPSLPTIEFIVSNKFYLVTRALKRMAWPAEDPETKAQDIIAICNENIDDFQTMYGLKYFEKDKSADIFGHVKKSGFKSMQKEFRSLPIEIDFLPMEWCYTQILDSHKCGDHDLWNKNKEEIKLLVKKIVGERVKGQVAFPESIWQKDNSLFVTGCYRRNVNCADFEKGVQPSDVNVIYNLHCLRAKHEVADEEATLSGFFYLKLKKEGRKVHLHAPNSSGPEISLKMIKQMMKELDSEKWTLQTLQEKVPAECKSAINLKESCPGIEVGYLDAIKMFELRIKKLVYHIFDVSSTKGFEEHFVLPEWQFIQYILPCFVTHLGQLATNSKVKPNELHAYTRFVHNLIQSFELNLIKTHISDGKIPDKLQMSDDLTLPEWVSKNQVNNVTVRLQEVESELGMLIHGTHKKTKKAGSADFPLGKICFLLLTDTLKHSTLNRGRPLIFKWWSELILQYVSKLKGAIFKEVMVPTNPFPINNLLQAVAVLEELKNVAVALNFHPVDELMLVCLDMADQKLKVMMGKLPGPLRVKIEKKQLHLEIQKLTVQQLLGLALYSIVVSRETLDQSMLEIFDPTRIFQSATINAAIEKFVAKDWCGLRALLTPLLCDKDLNDLSLVTMDFAKKSARSCYTRVHDAIKMKDSKKKHFISVLPVMPIKYCRCCEMFEVKLIKCKICVNNPDFPDIHWFCSDKCEEKVLAERHLEEHDYNLMVRCGLV